MRKNLQCRLRKLNENGVAGGGPSGVKLGTGWCTYRSVDPLATAANRAARRDISRYETRPTVRVNLFLSPLDSPVAAR
jgi:hypothetical protein